MTQHIPASEGIRKHGNDGFALDCECMWICPLYSSPTGASNGWATHVVDKVETQAKAALRAYQLRTGGS